MSARVSCSNISIEIRCWQDRDEAKRANSSILEANPDSVGGGSFYTFQQISDALVAEEAEIVGIQTDSLSEIPLILGSVWDSLIWVGCGSDLFLLTPQFELKDRIELDSRFSSFHLTEDGRRLVLLLETGLVAFADNLNQVWRVDLDIVTAVSWKSNSAVVSQMDNPSVRICLADGTFETLKEG